MSIQLELTVYGPELANALLKDDEEFAYFLSTVASEGNADKLGSDIHEYLLHPEDVATFLRSLADSIEAQE